MKMPDLSLYKVDLDTPQPNGRNGESPRTAFTKYNDALDEIGGGFVEQEEGKGLSTNDYTSQERNKLNGIATEATKNQTDAHLLDRANHTGTQSHETITGLGTAATADVTTSTTDSTVGRVLRVGDNGFGRNVITVPVGGNNFNNPEFNRGLSISLSDGSNLQQIPPTFYDGRTNVLSFGQDAYPAQILAQDDRLAFRAGSATSFNTQPFRTIYHTGNVVGAVSQAGGVPTGAILNAGVGPNGRWARHANGDLFIHRRILVSNVVGGVRVGILVTLPVELLQTAGFTGASVNVVSPSGTDQFQIQQLCINQHSTTQVKLMFLTDTPQSYEFTIILHARWY